METSDARMPQPLDPAWWKCHRKRRHRTRADAKLAIQVLRHSATFDGRDISAYHCSYCGGYHIGHVAAKGRKRA